MPTRTPFRSRGCARSPRRLFLPLGAARQVLAFVLHALILAAQTKADDDAAEDSSYPRIGYTLEQHKQRSEGRAASLERELDRLLSDDHGFRDEVELLELEISGVRKELAHYIQELADIEASHLEFHKFLADSVDALSRTGSSETIRSAIEAMRAGDISRADEILETACEGEATPRFIAAEAYFHRGQISDAHGDYRLALRHYERAVALNPLERRYLERAGALASAMGYYAKAILWIEEGLTLGHGASGSAHGTEARLLTDLGHAYGERADHERALATLELALAAAEAEFGADSVEASICHLQLGVALTHQGKHQEASARFEQRLNQLRSREPPPKVQIATTLSYLADAESESGNYGAVASRLDEIASLLDASDSPEDAATVSWNLGHLHAVAGRYKAAESCYRAALERESKAYGAEHPYVASLHEAIAMMNLELSRSELALEHARECHRLNEINYGPDHPDLATSMDLLSACYREMGEFETSLEWASQSLRIARDSLGPNHPFMIRALYQVGLLQRDLGRCEEAMDLLQQSMDLALSVYGPTHRWVAYSQSALAAGTLACGDLSEAVEQFRSALGILLQSLPPDHMTVAVAQTNLSWALYESGDVRGAVTLLEKAKSTVEKSIGLDSEDIVMICGAIGICWTELGDLSEAARSYEQAARSAALVRSLDDPNVATLWTMAGKTAVDADKYGIAQRCFEAARDQLARAFGPDHPDVAEANSVIESCKEALQYHHGQ